MSQSVPIHAVVTSLSIIETMAHADGPIGVSELARSTGTTKPRIYRHLRTLVDQGYVTQDPLTDKYLLSLRLFHLGQAIAEKTEFLSEARRIMPILRDRAKQTVTVGQAEDNGVRILDISRFRAEFEITTPPGTLFEFHSSAQGKIALAFGPKRLWQKVENHPLRKRTEKTNTDVARLKEEVDKIKKLGWAVAPEEVLIGINALAAPILDGTGMLAGTITIVGSVQYLKPKPAPELIAAVLDAAKQISTRLGYREAAAG
ncbi:MAG: IclR family transcriptional regulator [Alphaproteobacteria bacterium]|nr:MAG: IclR family transcriptional regulator [Alphaproteobacteria bacterium]